MILPILLSFLATLAAAVMAYGVHPTFGLGTIMMTRRLQWPLATVSIILSLALLALVISGKRRAWWLIGLLPVMALFTHRFLTAPINRFEVADEPAFVAAADAKFIGETDYVVGVVFNDESYAYPYACLYQTPVIVQSDRADRMLLMWSPRANAATALAVERELKARDFDIVSEPGDALLIYNGRIGQFISAMTALTPAGTTPISVIKRFHVTKTTWAQWKMLYPQTRAMLPASGNYKGPTRPLVGASDEPWVTLIAYPDAPPIAMLPDHISKSPVNILAADLPALVFRDHNNRVRAFDRHIEADLVPQFKLNTNAKRKGATFIDADTDSGWTMEGMAVDGPAKGKKLTPLEVQEDVWWHAARYWYRGIKMYQPSGLKRPQLGG